MSGDREPVIRVQGMDFWYGVHENQRQALFDIHLALYPGDFVALTGPSGSGKTTLLTLIGALRYVQSGSLRALGVELNGAKISDCIRVRQQTGFIFQQHNLFEALTAADNVRLAMQVKINYTQDEFLREPEHLLRQLGLEDCLRVKPGKMSRGQQQRVAVARALINHPPVILGDEPTAALDHRNSAQVIELLQERAEKERCVVLIVTHDPRIIDASARVIYMEEGRIARDVRQTS
jgi:putative ABC transport system ATP-binding protein